VYEDEWRVEVDLDDEKHGYGLSERFRAHDLDDEARERLGKRAVITRDGAQLFLYTGSESEAREAERVARELVASEGLTAAIAVTRWHPVEETWLDASIPLPRTEDEQREEQERKEETEWEQAEEGSYDWIVNVALPSRGAAGELASRLKDEGYPVHRRWRYVTVDVITEERANELAERLRGELPAEAEVWADASPEDVPNPAFVLLESRL
jgi:hypothetical protein